MKKYKQLTSEQRYAIDSGLKNGKNKKGISIQQYDWLHKRIKPDDIIVSLHKDYVRPIVRGKETKRVEFGPKVNKIQIDDISFIEHLSFNAFHEGIRFKKSIYTAENLIHTKIKTAGADAIYATNENRKFATKEGIKTDFKPKGPKPKDYKQRKQIRLEITKERVSRLEGSFGKDKECYHLRKI